MRISDWSSDVCSSALLSVGLLDPRRVWFHLVLRSEERAVQVALPGTLDKQALRRSIEAGLKRFAPGALRTVALSTQAPPRAPGRFRSEEHTSELQTLMRTSYAVLRLTKKRQYKH